jgi:hypothetical protein
LNKLDKIEFVTKGIGGLMTRYYILATQKANFQGGQGEAGIKVATDVFSISGSQVVEPRTGDLLMIAFEHNGTYEILEPTIFSVVGTTKKNVTLKQQQQYLEPIPFSQVRSFLNRVIAQGANEVSAEAFQGIRSQLGAPIIDEVTLLDHIKIYIAARGYYFDEETIHNYHICLKTRPFIILAGLSGTGKSKLSQLYAEAIGHTVKNNRYRRVAVRPSWNDDRYLLGYLNTITGEYVSEPALDFIIQAERDREQLYFFCLDEMNLAHVEYYFSQFLSALEEEDPADRRVPLFSQSLADSLADQGKAIAYEREVIIPPNLLFTGTINVDETTQPLSDKVIDRANTIEFFEVDLEKIPARRPTPEIIPVSATMWQRYRAVEPDARYRSSIVEIGRILNKAGLGLGYRVLREIELYLANSHGLLEPNDAFDLQVKQRILPRVRGTLTMRDTLRELIAFAKKQGLPRSTARLEEMDLRLTRDGYTSFWR